MASERRPLESAPSADPPSTSSAAAGDRKVKLRCSYGGKILPRLSDGALRYVGGETRIITVRRDSPLPEIIHKMAEAYGGQVVLRYQLPDEDLDALISVSTPEDLENMMEEYDKLACENPNAKLRVFLFSPSEVAGVGADPLAPYLDPQDTGARYLEAVNGLDSSIRRRDSATSFSTQNSDGMMATEAVVNAGMSPTAMSARDASQFVFAGQDVPDWLLATSSSDPTQFLSSIQTDMPPMVLNQSKILNSTQAELPSVAPYVPQPYIDPQHAAQMMNPQSFMVMGLPPQVNVVAVPPHAYVPPVHTTTPAFQVGNGTTVQTRVDQHLDNPNGGRIAKQPLSQLPPLPPPHLLAPNVERRQVPSLSQVPTMRLEDCSLCQKALPHAHSDTLINEQGKGNWLRHASPEANLQSHHSEDLARMRTPQVVDVGMPVDSAVETQATNLIAAGLSKTYELSETITEMPWDSRTPVTVNVTNPDHANVFVPPVSVGLSGTSQASYGTIISPQKSHQQDSLYVQKQQEVSLTLGHNGGHRDHSNILLTPASLALPWDPYGTFIIPAQPHGEESLQQRMQLPQPMGFPKYSVNQKIFSNPFVANASLSGNSDFQEDGQSVHGAVPGFLYRYVGPVDGTMGALFLNPPGAPGFSDRPRPIFMADIGTSKDLKPEQPSLVTVNTHNTAPLDRGNESSLGNPLISSVVVPEENAGVLVDQQPSVLRDAAYLQSVQLANTSHTPNIVGNHGLHSYHLEAGVGPRGMFKYVDPSVNNNAINKNPIGEQKDEASIFHPADVSSDVTIPHSDSVIDQLQQAVSSNPLVSSKDPQKTQGSTVMPSISSNVSRRDPTAIKDFSNKNYPVNSIGSEKTIPVDGVPSCLTDTLNIDMPTELEHPLKDLAGDAHMKQDIQTFERRASASALESSEVSKPVLISHETKEGSPSCDKECGDIEKEVEIDDQTETIKTKQSEKVWNGFPNTDDIGHLQVIKNSDLEELQELGSGTFGTVYHGKWRGTDVAIKRINDRVFAGKPSEQERARADFWNEACKLASLHHPNVVAFYGIVLDGPGGSIATVTEFMVNGSLRHALQKNEKILDRRRRLLIAMDVAFGMEYLHSKNIIHFDLKSDNLLVNLRDPQRPICKVGDLGLSKVKYETLMSGGMRGTLPWMAPELLGGKDNKYTEKVDVFSFGIVMWELITGEEPYGDMHYGAIIGGILNDTLRPPVPESCDPEWRSLMEQCWATEPSQRPSFTEIARRLRATAASLPHKG